jgi:hypothetical protein
MVSEYNLGDNGEKDFRSIAIGNLGNLGLFGIVFSNVVIFMLAPFTLTSYESIKNCRYVADTVILLLLAQRCNNLMVVTGTTPVSCNCLVCGWRIVVVAASEAIDH